MSPSRLHSRKAVALHRRGVHHGLPSAEFGVVTEQPTLDWDAALARKTQTVEGVVRGLGGLLKKKGVEVITGYGRLAGGQRSRSKAKTAGARSREVR